MNVGGRAMRVRYWFMAALCLTAVAGSAQAGANAGGYMVFYTNDAIDYTSDTVTYSGLSNVTCPNDASCPPYDAPGASECSANKSTVQNSFTSNKGSSIAVWWLLAGWPQAPSSDTCPKLAGTQFGIDYDPAKVTLVAWGTDANFELTTNYGGNPWPAPRSGTALTWNSPKTSHLTEVYWFAGYATYGDPTTFSVANHPAGNSPPVFGDNGVPSQLDPVGVGYGGNGNQAFLPILGLAGSAGGTNGDITPTRKTTWGAVKTLYGRD